MPRVPLPALALLLVAASAAAQDPAFVGRFELAGRYQPTLRRTTVSLDVQADAQGALTVTRRARVGTKSIEWRSTSARAVGQRLTVRYETGGGLSGNVPGAGPANTFTATYFLTADAQRLTERVRNVTRNPPETWTGIQASGGRAATPDLGATELPDMAAFDAFARRDDVPGAPGVRSVKLLMVGVDTASPTLYLIDTKRCVYHYDFYTRGLGHAMSLEEFNRRTYFSDARSNIAGTVLYHESYVAPDGARGLFALEFWPTDPVKVAHVAQAFHALVRALPFARGRIAYHPAGETQEALHAQERARYEQARVRVVTTTELFGAMTYAAMNLAEGYGTLRVIDPAQPGRPASVRDVVIFRQLPNDLSHTGGIITEQPQTPLSHVNLKAKQNHTPNAFIEGASTHPRVAPLLGKIVYFRVGADDFELREATAAEAEAFLERLRPANPTTPPRDLTETRIRPLSDLGHADVDTVGAKAANTAELRRLLGPDVVPGGFAIPFWCYDEFMKANGFYERARAFMAQPAFRADPAERERVLDAFRRDVRRGTVPPAVAARLRELQARFPAGTPIRCRSSTNNEDLPGFNGAGLYDSYTHRPDEGDLERTVKQVWASLWNFRAFEERDFYRIDHMTAAMGVLVLSALRGVERGSWRLASRTRLELIGRSAATVAWTEDGEVDVIRRGDEALRRWREGEPFHIDTPPETDKAGRLVGLYSAPGGGAWHEAVELSAGGRFEARDSNSGFAGGQLSKETGAWRLVDDRTVEVRITARSHDVDRGGASTSDARTVDERETLEVVWDEWGFVQELRRGGTAYRP